ncbi:MAG: response regulator [Lachnospiraceae bacterium]|nr:response regulator [Lachnospiraceae bacterium]
MKKKSIFKERSLIATGIMIIAIGVLFLTAYFEIASLIEKRSLGRMEEGVKTATADIVDKLERDSQILNAAADILAATDALDEAAFREAMGSIAPLVDTMKIRILLPDDTVLDANGTKIADAGLSFEKLAKQGESVSNRMTSVKDGNTLILRHYVPIVKDGKTEAILYGVTLLEELPTVLNIDNIYNASADVYIIDMENGEFIMDTRHDSLGNIYDLKSPAVKGNITWDQAVHSVMAGETGYFVLREQGEDEWLYLYYAPADINQWTIAVSVPEKEAFTNLYAIRRIFLIVAAFMLVVIVAYYLWVYWNAKQSLARAVEQAVLEEKLQKAEAAERAKTMFLSNMSHDIRTPMNAIIGFTTLAETNIDNKERVQEYLAKILSSSNHLLSLINDVLDMSRIESGRLNIEEKECGISDIFRDMRNIIQTQIESKQLNFFMDTIDVIDENIYCDKLHINQVLLNLLSNAIKFTPAGGSVSLTIKQNPGAPEGYGAYEIRVKDTGIGMSPEFVEHLFEPFERERNSTVSGIQGTGLGMPISKSIVEAMGGTIEVETEQGKGTEFVLNLEFRLVPERKQVETIRELEGLRALVVDDNFTTCDSVTKMLTQIGMRAEWTLHGKEAVLRARQAIEMKDEFYAYIIDWALPDLGGLEVARQIRSIAGENIPIIILTAYDWSLFEEEAREAGVTGFCNKPIFMSELRDTLANVMGKAEEEVQEAILPETAEELRGKRLLLVEDNELNREIAEEILEESGFVVETAEDGTIAVDKVKESSPGYYDLILMDVQMPIMNGYDATRAIRALENPDLAGIPIVAMTANAFDEDRKMAMDSGMNAHVAKPIDVKKLMEAIHGLLK